MIDRLSPQRFAIIVVSMLVVASGVAIVLSRAHAQTDTTVVPVEGVTVSPDGTPLTDVTTTTDTTNEAAPAMQTQLQPQGMQHVLQIATNTNTFAEVNRKLDFLIQRVNVLTAQCVPTR